MSHILVYLIYYFYVYEVLFGVRDLLRSALSCLPEQKACKLETNLPVKQALPFVQSSFANVHLMKAIFAKAWVNCVTTFVRALVLP
jgi:hypothetical protein